MSILNTRNVKYNGYNLESITGFSILEIDPDSAPARDLKISDLSSTDGSVVSADYYKGKRIVVKGMILRTSKGEVEQSIDELKSRLDYREVTLSVPQSNTTREYVATYQNLSISDRDGGYCKVDIDFICSDPMGYAPTYTTLKDALNLTTDNQSYQFDVDGTGEQLPIISITIDTVTGGTGDLIWQNLTLGTTTTINRTWANADFLVMNAEAGTITVNGEDADFTGPIPKLAPGSNTVVYNDEFTTRQVDINVIHRKRYI